jgi:hypothetical protein
VYPGSGEASDFGNFTLSFEATSGGAAHEDVPVENIDSPITVDDLVLGTYTITVTATKADDDNVVAVGKATGVEVNAASATIPVLVEIIMGPETGEDLDDGTFAYDITVPDEAKSAALTITDLGGEVVDDNEGIDVKAAGTGSVDLAPGYYWADVVLDDGSGGWEALHIYSGMTSTWTVEFGGEEIPPGGISVTIGFGHDNIPVSVTPESATVTQGTDIVFAVTGGGYTGVKWYTDGKLSDVMAAAEYTVDTSTLYAGAHTVTVRAVKNGKPYRDIFEFTVTEPGADVQVSASGLAAALENIPTGSADNPTTVVFESFDVNSNTWGNTICSALNGNTKYLVLDLTACTATSNTIIGASSPTGNNFNRIKSEYIVGVILPSTLVSIGSSSCRDWAGLKSVVIPESVTSIETNAFNNSGLTSITIPGNVATVGNYAFYNCAALEKVIFEGNPTIGTTIFTGVQGDLQTFFTDQGTKKGTYVYGGESWSKQ